MNTKFIVFQTRKIQSNLKTDAHFSLRRRAMLKNIFSGKESMRCPLCGSKKSEKLDGASPEANDIMDLLQSKINAASPELARYNKHT